jgi:hypothetical protein
MSNIDRRCWFQLFQSKINAWWNDECLQIIRQILIKDYINYYFRK